MGVQFKKGKSGNPNGRPKGSSNEVTQILKDNAVDLLRLAIKHAKEGDKVMLSKLIDKIAPNLNKNDEKHSGNLTGTFTIEVKKFV